MHLVDEILCKLETADNTTKNQLENKLVEQGYKEVTISETKKVYHNNKYQ